MEPRIESPLGETPRPINLAALLMELQQCRSTIRQLVTALDRGSEIDRWRAIEAGKRRLEAAERFERSGGW